VADGMQNVYGPVRENPGLPKGATPGVTPGYSRTAHPQHKPSRAAWTTREIRVLREAYPAGGINGVIALLPHRSRSAIYQHAHALGLRCASRPLVRESWTLQPGMDEAITTAHQRPMQRGDVVALAKRLARPVWWVSRRARDLGLTTPRFRELPWSREELALLRDTRNLRPEAVQRALHRRGFRRTTTAITVQRKRHQVQRDPRDDNYTAREVADPLHTISAGGEHHAVIECTLSPEHEAGALRVAAFLVKYYGTALGVDIAEPLDTITTRDRLALVTVLVQGTPYVIVDIGLRMLRREELFRAQGFPSDYIIDTTADGRKLSISASVRMVGNSVSPPPLCALARANLDSADVLERMAA
jgi:C-5 cytosine-specific DNA methylase